MGNGIERSHGDGRIDARDAVQAVNQTLTALHIFVVHLAQILLGCLQRRFGHNLSDKGRGESCLTEFHHGLPHFCVLRDECTDTDTALRVALRHGVNQDDVLLDTLQVAGADVWRTRIDVFAIHLVREQIQVVLLYQIANLVHLAACVQIARRVVRVANHDGACAVVDELLKLLYLRQRETLLDGRCNGANLCSCRDSKRHVVGVGRLRHDDFVARIEARQECKQHRLRTSRGDDDIVSRHINIIFRVVADEFLAIAQIALRG